MMFMAGRRGAAAVLPVRRQAGRDGRIGRSVTGKGQHGVRRKLMPDPKPKQIYLNPGSLMDPPPLMGTRSSGGYRERGPGAPRNRRPGNRLQATLAPPVRPEPSNADAVAAAAGPHG
jgi:hypothetical protein